jgi:hypothetical protein
MKEKVYLKVKVGLGEDLPNILFRYSKNFTRWPEGDPDVQKFFLVEEGEGHTNYITVSDTKGGVTSIPMEYYNITVIVHGNNEERVVQTMGDLEKKLGLPLRKAPEELIERHRKFAKYTDKILIHLE